VLRKFKNIVNYLSFKILDDLLREKSTTVGLRFITTYSLINLFLISKDWKIELLLKLTDPFWRTSGWGSHRKLLILQLLRIRASDLLQFGINFWNYELFRHSVGLLGRGIGPPQGHRTTQAQERKGIHPWSLTGFDAMILKLKLSKMHYRF
jgi:hypothetical protein